MPPSGRLKLNVDGAFMMTSGRAGGGGILRDHEGNMCWAFAWTYHVLNSSLAAEAMALKDGLSICCSKGVTEVRVETDSLNLFQLFTNQISSSWDLAEKVVVMTMVSTQLWLSVDTKLKSSEDFQESKPVVSTQVHHVLTHHVFIETSQRKRSQWCRHRSIMCRHILWSQKPARNDEVSGVDTSPSCVDTSCVLRKLHF
ncbi:hypothetical protein Taro_001149 [Colocasia esculenta]|uniref:RNase H type-1 domain-containing protein n=1 Tax=Colocasia esculenta TaxID=4460 RepID=A0A843TDW7_COLES|nr:hypothetical protein [Colocasia esculenta]